MRVLLISHSCQTPAEGQPKVRCLANMPDVDLRVLIPDRWNHYGHWRSAEVDPDLTDHVRVGRVRWPWAGPASWYLHWYPELPDVVRGFQPDVIDLWEEPWGLVNAHACRVRDRVAPHAKVVVETEQNINKRLPPPFEQVRRHVLRRADYLVARSSEALDVVRAKGYAGPAEVVPNAVDAELFHPMDRAACRAELGLDGFVVGYVGRLIEQKGVTDLVEAVAQCPPDVTLVVVGTGPLAADLPALAARSGLDGRLRVLPARPLEQLPQVMNAMDVLALPSRTTPRWKEQFGRVLIEAHACATPVIGSDSGAIPDVVGTGGLVVPEQDPAALARAILTLRDDPALRARLGQAGRTAVGHQYTWQQVAERMRDVYAHALATPPRGR